MAQKNETYNEHGHRQVDPTMREAPTFKYVCGVSLCPGCGPCIADYNVARENSNKEQPKPPVIVLGSMEEFKKSGLELKEFMDVKKHCDNSATCAAPLQMEMKPGEAVPIYKNPDAVLSCLSICCGWRFLAVGFFAAYSIPPTIAAKYGLGMFAVATISACLAMSLVMRVLAIICPNWFNMKTPSMRDTFLNVIDIKRVDLLEMKSVEKDGFWAKPKLQFWRAVDYFLMILKGFLCCQFFRPSVIFTFAKVLITMIFTEIMMTVSSYFFFLGRFACGSACWTLGSLMAWVREFRMSQELKTRVTHMKYPQWGFEAADGMQTEAPTPEAKCCGIDWANCGACLCGPCKSCPGCGACCSMCPQCCDLCCQISCPLAWSMFDVAIEIGGDLFSAILLVGKALHYTHRLVMKGKEANQGGQVAENQDERV